MDTELACIWLSVHLWLFLAAQITYEARSAVKDGDGSENWKQKRKEIARLFRARDPSVEPNRDHQDALIFLFPELRENFVYNPASWLAQHKTPKPLPQ